MGLGNGGESEGFLFFSVLRGWGEVVDFRYSGGSVKFSKKKMNSSLRYTSLLPPLRPTDTGSTPPVTLNHRQKNRTKVSSQVFIYLITIPITPKIETCT